MNIVELGCRCGTLWFFNLPSAKKLIFSLKFDQFDPFYQMTQKVCQKSALKNEKTLILVKLRNSESAGGSGSDIRATSILQVGTSLSVINRLWWVLEWWGHLFFTFRIIGCVSEMALNWPILGQTSIFGQLRASKAPDGWQKWKKGWITVKHMWGDYPRCKTCQKNAPIVMEMAQKWPLLGPKRFFWP